MTCECVGKMKSCMGPRETWAARARRWWLCYQTMKRGLAPVYLPGLDCLSIIMFNSLKGRIMNSVTVFHTTPHIVSINLQQNWKGPWLEKLSLLCAVWSWGHKLLTLLLPHLPVMFLLFPGLVLSRGMCTELFQFHISPVASTPSNQTSDSDTPLRMLQTQWLQKLHEEALIRTCLLNFGSFDASKAGGILLLFLYPPLPSGRISGGKNGSDPKVEKMVRDQHHQQGEVENQSSMVVSVLAGPQEFAGTSRRKGGKGMSRIFVVVLADGVRYVT